MLPGFGRRLAAVLVLSCWSPCGAEEPSGTPQVVTAAVDEPGAASSDQRRQAQQDVQKTVDRFKKTLPVAPQEDPSALLDPMEVPAVIGGSREHGWVPPAAPPAAPGPSVGARSAAGAEAPEKPLPIFAAEPREGRAAPNAAEPGSWQDLLASARVFAHPFQALGLRVGLGSDRRPRIVRSDGSPATEEDLQAALDEVRREPRALQKFRSFFSFISRSKFAELKRDYANPEVRDAAFLHVELTDDGRDFRWSRSCAAVSSECNPFVRSASYQKGKYVHPQDLAGIWSGLAKADGRPDPDERPKRGAAPLEDDDGLAPSRFHSRLWYFCVGASLLIFWLWIAAKKGAFSPAPEGVALIPINPESAQAPKLP